MIKSASAQFNNYILVVLSGTDLWNTLSRFKEIEFTGKFCTALIYGLKPKNLKMLQPNYPCSPTATMAKTDHQWWRGEFSSALSAPRDSLTSRVRILQSTAAPTPPAAPSPCTIYQAPTVPLPLPLPRRARIAVSQGTFSKKWIGKLLFDARDRDVLWSSSSLTLYTYFRTVSSLCLLSTLLNQFKLVYGPLGRSTCTVLYSNQFCPGQSGKNWMCQSQGLTVLIYILCLQAIKKLFFP